MGTTLKVNIARHEVNSLTAFDSGKPMEEIKSGVWLR
jgi:hypothetical protein